MLESTAFPVFPNFGTANGWQVETFAYLALGPSITRTQLAAIDTNIRLIKHSTGITLASVTCNLSLVSGYYFITRSSVDLRPYSFIPGVQFPGVQFSVSDGSKAAVFSGAMTAGTGETLDSELITDGNMEAVGVAAYANYSTPTTKEKSGVQKHAGSQSLHVASTSPNNGGVSQSFNVTAGALYKIGAWGYVQTNKMRFARLTGTYFSFISSDMNAATWTEYNVYQTSLATGSAGLRAESNSTNSAEWYTDDWTAKKILTPDTSGLSSATIADAGINPNAASFTVTITKL